MATPNWDILHLRFASSIRDGVSSASANGSELTVSDRDAYLNFAYSKYVRLIGLYNKKAHDGILPELFKTEFISASNGVASLPDDLGFLIDASPVVSGATLDLIEASEFLKYKYSSTLQSPSSNTLMRARLVAGNLELLPTSYTGQIEISYLFYETLTEGTGDDLTIGAEHWDVIVAFAKYSYYQDKQEFQIATAILNDAIMNSPFKITEKIND